MVSLWLMLAGVWTICLHVGVVSSLSGLPLSTSGRWIVDNQGKIVTYAGVNWPGHMEAMIPEGLQYQSIANIVAKIRSLGMNSIRLTYATEMVDNIIDQGGDVSIRSSFIKALGQQKGSDVFSKVLKSNPSFTASTTRLQVFDAVAAECNKQNIIVHLDNHMSKATWCCGTNDGNSWFGDNSFNTDHWKRGWRFMANHTKSWPAMASVGMRNELRSPDNKPELKSRSYKWPDWYTHMKSCAEGIHAANPNLLVFFSGLGFDTDLSPIPTGANLGDGRKFRKSDFPKDKTVLELHNYQNKVNDCNQIKSGLLRGGWNALGSKNTSIVNVLPVVMTEFGFFQDAKTADSVHAKCLKDFLISNRAGWTVWVLSGSYYLRQGKQDSDETWGLLNHDWSDWRSSAVIRNYIIPLVKGTLR